MSSSASLSPISTRLDPSEVKAILSSSVISRNSPSPLCRLQQVAGGVKRVFKGPYQASDLGDLQTHLAYVAFHEKVEKIADFSVRLPGNQRLHHDDQGRYWLSMDHVSIGGAVEGSVWAASSRLRIQPQWSHETVANLMMELALRYIFCVGGGSVDNVLVTQPIFEQDILVMTGLARPHAFGDSNPTYETLLATLLTHRPLDKSIEYYINLWLDHPRWGLRNGVLAWWNALQRELTQPCPTDGPEIYEEFYDHLDFDRISALWTIFAMAPLDFEDYGDFDNDSDEKFPSPESAIKDEQVIMDEQ